MMQLVLQILQMTFPMGEVVVTNETKNGRGAKERQGRTGDQK